MTVHVIGGGLAGLAAAAALAKAGVPAILYEAAAQAGGRCRAFFDPALGRVIDNGNHLVLAGNGHVRRYLALLDAGDRLVGPAGDGFRFVDLARNREFRLRPNPGRLPWWIACPYRRVPDTRAPDYLALRRLSRAGPSDTVASLVPDGELYRCLIEPLTVSVLNTPADEASARAFWTVMTHTLAKSGAASMPLVVRESLSDTFVTPVLEFLARHEVAARLQARVTGLGFHDRRVSALTIGPDTIALAPGDQIVLAVPPSIAAALLPGLMAPTVEEPIVNAHFAIPDDGPHSVTGIVGGTAHWVFRRPGLASVTVSAARGLVNEPAEVLAQRLWADVMRAEPGLAGDLPPYRVIKEKRATIRQSPHDEALRPQCRTRYANLWLAGDWTATGLPATIDGSLLSGFRAADRAMRGGG